MRLGQLVSVRKGKKPEAVVAAAAPGYRRLIQIDDLRPGARPKFCPPARDEVIAETSDVIIAWDGANAATSGFGLAGAIGSTLALLRPTRDGIFTPYLGHFMRSQERYLRERRQGATVPHIDGRALRALELALPPLAEQLRIAEILDTAEALRTKRRAALAQLDTLTQAIFLDMFGDPAENTRGWPVCTLAQVARTITDGTHKTPRYRESGVVFLSAKDLKGGTILWDTRKFISRDEHIELTKRCNPESGDVLLAKSGSLGSVALIDREVDCSLFESLCLIKPRRELLEGGFLIDMLRSPSMLSRLLAKNKGIAVKHLHLVDIRSLVIPLPPVGLQREYTGLSRAINDVRASQRRSLSDLDALFSALQNRAFGGEL